MNIYRALKTMRPTKFAINFWVYFVWHVEVRVNFCIHSTIIKLHQFDLYLIFFLYYILLRFQYTLYFLCFFRVLYKIFFSCMLMAGSIDIIFLFYNRWINLMHIGTVQRLSFNLCLYIHLTWKQIVQHLFFGSNRKIICCFYVIECTVLIICTYHTIVIFTYRTTYKRCLERIYSLIDLCHRLQIGLMLFFISQYVIIINWFVITFAAALSIKTRWNSYSVWRLSKWHWFQFDSIWFLYIFWKQWINWSFVYFVIQHFMIYDWMRWKDVYRLINRIILSSILTVFIHHVLINNSNEKIWIQKLKYYIEFAY